MAVDKLTPRYLNKDNDERLIKSVEMTDALNLRISSENDGDGLVIKNAYGNTEVSLVTALPLGTNKVIGSVAVESTGSIYFFVWNSNDDHSIYKYSTGSNSARLVYRDSVLAFNENGFIQANVVIDGDGDELLYFNDSKTAPKKINASKALRGEYSSLLSSGTDEQKLLFLTVAKQPPLKAPTFNIVNNPDVKDNRIKDKLFQFAYKYVYEDGEHSALSPYSSTAVSLSQLRDGFNTESAKDFYNQINVFIRHTTADVEKMVLYARNGDSGVFYEVAEVDNNGTSNVHTVNFTNDTVGAALSETDAQKLYDNVPQLADSQEIVEGRLMYGGYTEGYPNIETDVSLVDNYKDIDPLYNIGVYPYSTATNTKLVLDATDLPNTFSENSVIYIDLIVSGDRVDIGGNTPTSKLTTLPLTLITFVEESGDNPTTYTITKTEEYIPFISSGIRISERVKIPSGTTRAGALALLIAKLESNYYTLQLRPTVDQYIDLNISQTNFTEETARFTGTATIKPVALSTNEVELDIINLKLYVNEFFKANKKQEILDAGIIDVDYAFHNLSYLIDDIYAIGSSYASSEKDSSTKSFKSGSSHKLGIVYYDDRNRSGGAQEVGDVYINSLNDRLKENELYGSSSIVMRVSHNAPTWAKKWAPVYIGYGSNELKLMYGVDGAFIPFRSNSLVQNSSPGKLIYISLNSIFGEDRGYNDSTGADLNYAFEKGDKLRVIQYGEGLRTNKEFNVVGFKTLVDDIENPILDNSSDDGIQATTGEFLIISENTDATGFTVKSILNRNTNWSKKCIVEIYRPKQTEDNIYYEIGPNYEIVNGVHQDDRSSTSLDLTISVSSNGLLEGNTATRIFKGDVISVGQNSIIIGNVYKKGNSYYFYATDKSITPLGVGSYTGANVTSVEKVIEITQGDIYFRKRLNYVSPTDVNFVQGDAMYRGMIGIVTYIEDYSVSDFFDSKSGSIGRPIAYIPDAKTYKRKASITYSDVFTIDGSRNGLSSFNLSLANFKDLSYEEGTINALLSYNQKLYFIQESGCGALAVNRNVITTAQGDSLVALSTNVLQSEQYYAGNYGTQNRESVADKDGNVYFVDVNAGKVVSLGNSGMKLISDVNMDSYFTERLGKITSYQPKLIVGGIDTENEEYIVSTETLSEAGIRVDAVASSPGTEYNYTAQIDSTGTKVIANIAYNPLAVWNFSSDPRTFGNTCDYFDDSAGALVYLDDLVNGGSVYVNVPSQVNGLYGIATNSNLDFFVTIRVDTTLPGFTFDNPFCNTDDDGYITPSQTILEGFTAAYSYENNAWTTEYSFVPEDVVSVHNKMYSFKSGKMYVHQETADRNSFYGSPAAQSVIEVVSRTSPSAVKAYESLSIEGNSAWDTTISTTEQTAVIDDTSFKQKEGMYYTYVHGATKTKGNTITSTSSTNEFFSLGVVDSVSNDTIIFKNDIASINFPLGTNSKLYKINGNQLEILQVTASSVSGTKSLTCSGTVQGVSQNNVVVLVADSAIEGDQIRDYYAKIRLTKTDTNPVELFAINAVVTDSKAHN
jgi:hypothetical protein